MRADLFDYDLPRELIAQEPVTPRDSSRLLVLLPEGAGRPWEHRVFRDLPEYLREDDLLVLNETRVLPARLLGRKVPGGGRVEVLLLRPAAGRVLARPGDWAGAWEWEVLVSPGRRVRPGTRIAFWERDQGDAAAGAAAGEGEPQGEEEPRLLGEVLERTQAGGRVVAFRGRPGESFASAVAALGRVPLPPYITRPLDDAERYQTVYARVEGSAAAPTAGLHFTPEVFSRLGQRGVRVTAVTLHIGLDTFRPVREEEIEEHRMHSEWYEVSAEAARAVAECRERGGRVVACGTTVVRTLEAAADPEAPGLVRAGSGWTDLFIRPGYRFRVVDVLLTNFHLPRSTLLMLVAAFGGTERVLEAYREAVRQRYRFYSFGDAMLVFPDEPAVGERGRPRAGCRPVQGGSRSECASSSRPAATAPAGRGRGF
ncbi:MAG: tRNA preQ1(34) S-adenosylmethionine ribosyltransferase-isomerase QueA [Firmicutes bacterium]|nr:tRNA preQ1(34) S-adenosylmethionine ribosyltransferase-isomerase QueA [Bacillota bacterium]